MGLLYKKKEDIVYDVDFSLKGEDGKELVCLYFYCDGGKHGAIEAVDGYELTAKELLDILQNNFKD